MNYGANDKSMIAESSDALNSSDLEFESNEEALIE